MRRLVLLLAVVVAGTLLTARPGGEPAPLPAPGSASATPAERAALLRRWAPELRLDVRERAAPVRAAAFAAAARRTAAGDLDLVREPRSAPVLHGHAVAQDGRLWLQWWALWADNPQDRGVLRTGRHEGDWELVQVVLGPDRRPAAATFAQHGWVVGCAAAGRAPVVWVANGSHASYPRRGTGDRPWPDPDDEARGDGRRLRPRVDPVGAWVREPGRWGGSRASRWVPGEADSPRGPAFQGDRFTRPASLHARARACGAPPPAFPWWLRAAVLGVVALGAAGLARRALR